LKKGSEKEGEDDKFQLLTFIWKSIYESNCECKR